MRSDNPTTDVSMDGGKPAGLRWTGHPLVDHGIATLVAFADLERGGVRAPESVTTDDLEAFAVYAERALGAKTVTSHASVLFTSNVPYLQPSFTPERRAESARRMLRAFNAASDATGADLCAYCGQSAVRLASSSGRAYRDTLPLLTGQGVLNFAPGGDHGLSLCGTCIVSLQALLLGAPSCEGRALVVQADDPDFLIALVRSWLPDMRRRVQLSVDIGDKVETWKAPRTRLVEQIVAMEREHEQAEAATGLTIYHLSNSGQGPGIGIYALGARVVRFVRLAQGPRYRQAWRHLERRAWRDAKRKDADHDPDAGERPYWRNTFYDELFDLPAASSRFVRRRFMSPRRAALEANTADAHVPMWSLTGLFLREVMGVDKERVEAIRALADVLADEIVENNDRPLFRSAFNANRYMSIRSLLIRASTRRMNRDLPPLVDFQGFLLIFEEAEEAARPDWHLAWDLVLIRLVDKLYERGWVREHKDELADVTARLGEADEQGEPLPVGE